MHRFMRRLGLAALPLMLLAAGCGNSELNSTVVTGSADDLGDGVVRSWGFLDPADVPQQINISFSPNSVKNLDPAGETAVIAVPRNTGTPYTHIVVSWLPAGHAGATGVFATPTFGIHFFTLPEVDRLLIDVADPEMAIHPGAAFMPAGYASNDASGTDEIGLYWNQPTADIEGAASFGSFDGETIFTAFWFTPTFLESKTAMNLAIPQPASVAKSGYYPTVVQVVVGEGQSDYQVTFSDFVFRVATPAP
ncbi:MAG: hypothetical protein AMXMBFR81_05080 [Chthonomonas sp.]